MAAVAAEDAGLQQPWQRSCAIIRQDGISAAAVSATDLPSLGGGLSSI
jgi:hypothetical protein